MPRMTEEMKRARRFAREAAKKTAKELGQAGLFAPLVRETTAAEEHWRWRRNKAEAAERLAVICGPARRALDWLTIHAWKRRALAVVPHTTAAALLATEWGIEARHGGNEHYASLWGCALRAAGIDPGTWCTPTEPEPHDDCGLTQLLAEVFP